MTESKECISNAISELHDTHPTWKDKQIVAASYGKCGKAKEDFEDGFCPYKVLSRIRFIRGLEKEIYTNDFTDIPTSIRITKAVNENLPKLKSDFPNTDQLEVLKMAYDMARGVLNNSDFETVEEEEIYFEIYIDNPEVFEAELQRQYIETLTADEDFNPEDLVDFTDDKAQAKFFAKDKAVKSSNVAEIGYERGKLRIFFKNGGGYEYPVPSSWYTEMLNAPSKGSFVWETLRGKTPGRVIDNPNKITPGGVGGSIVPYFKIKGAAMPPDAMRKSVRSFLTAARRGKAEVGGVPIRRIPKPEFKAFKRFLKKGVLKFTPEEGKPKKPSSRKPGTPRTFKKIVRKILTKKKGKSESEEKTTETEDNSAIRERIKRIRKALKDARKSGLGDVIIQAMENRIKQLEKSISDYIDFIKYYNITDDFIDDMRYFSGPITRAGEFQYHNQTKIKDYDNLTEVFNEISHLPSFDSHNEDQILGFAYNFTGNPDTEQFFSEGYTFNNIEETANISLDSNSKLPVSIRFLDANEGTGNPEQHITDLIHLAISVNQTDTDRCSSAGGRPCYVQFQDTKDFSENTQKQLEQKTVGDLMPDKNEKEKEKKPPKDKDEEEDKEDEKKKKESSDQAKQDPEMDAEYKSEEKNTKDFDDRKYMKVTIEDWENINKSVSDMASREKKRIAVVNEIELSKIKSDFTNKEQIYKISSDFIKTASLDDMQTLKVALVEHNPDVDAQSQLFSSDFGSGLDNIKKEMAELYGVNKK